MRPLAARTTTQCASCSLRVGRVAAERGSVLVEKYTTESNRLIGGGGEYRTVEGFGWSNGVALDLLATYGREMSSSHFKHFDTSKDDLATGEHRDKPDDGGDAHMPSLPPPGVTADAGSAKEAPPSTAAAASGRATTTLVTVALLARALLPLLRV